MARIDSHRKLLVGEDHTCHGSHHQMALEGDLACYGPHRQKLAVAVCRNPCRKMLGTAGLAWEWRCK
jgi:hypothetical protein